MLGKQVYPDCVIAADEAQSLLELSVIDYREACEKGLLKGSVKVETMLKNALTFHNFWDLLEFDIHRRLLASGSSDVGLVACDIVDEIARCFDQRDQDEFDPKLSDFIIIIRYLADGVVSDVRSVQPIFLAREVLISLQTLVISCIKACNRSDVVMMVGSQKGGSISSKDFCMQSKAF